MNLSQEKPFFSKSQIDEKSLLQGFAKSRLPKFTQEESEEILGSADFLGINHYTSFLTYPTPNQLRKVNEVSYFTDSDVSEFQDPKWIR